MKTNFYKKRGSTPELIEGNFVKKNITTKLVRGFTLVETLVAIGILSISILATFTAVQVSLQYSTTAKDRITAFFLAQEAMEYIKNIRDENALNYIDTATGSWLTGLSNVAGDPCYFGKTCRIDSPAKTVVDCGGAFGSCPNLQQDPASNLFGYTAGPATIFKREIQFTQNSADEVLVTIRMSWTARGVNRFFQVTQLLFNR